MGVDRDGRLAEGDVEDDVGGLATNAREFLQLFTLPWNLPVELVDEDPGGSDDILRLGIEKTDGWS